MEQQRDDMEVSSRRVQLERVEEQPGTASKKPKKIRKKAKRFSFIWFLKKMIVPLLFVLAFIGGLYTGYVVLGKGSADDVFKLTTWTHMYDLVYGEL